MSCFHGDLFREHCAHTDSCAVAGAEFWPDSWRPVPKGCFHLRSAFPAPSVFLGPKVGGPHEEKVIPELGKRKVPFCILLCSLFPTWTLHLELILYFYSFVYAQFFGMREVLGTDDSVSNSPKLSVFVTQITLLQDDISGPIISDLWLR